MLSENSADLLTLLFMLLFILSCFFIFFKNKWLAWLVGTLLSPFLGILFLSIIYDPLALLYLYGLPYILIATALVSTLIGLLKIYLMRKSKRAS